MPKKRLTLADRNRARIALETTPKTGRTLADRNSAAIAFDPYPEFDFSPKTRTVAQPTPTGPSVKAPQKAARQPRSAAIPAETGESATAKEEAFLLRHGRG